MSNDDLKHTHQKMSYSGVGTHGKNGVVERAIQTVVNYSRTMILLQALLWLDNFDMRILSLALQHTAYLWNKLPNMDSGVEPLEIYAGSSLYQSILRNEKIGGCPSYVLDPKLQDGEKLPKWDPITQQHQYLGKYSTHASSVGLRRNLRSGYIPPNFMSYMIIGFKK